MGAVYLIRHGQASFGAANYDQPPPPACEQPKSAGAETLRARFPSWTRCACRTMVRHLPAPRTPAWRRWAWSCRSRSCPASTKYDHEQMVERYQPRYADKRQLAADIAKSPETAPRLPGDLHQGHGALGQRPPRRRVHRILPWAGKAGVRCVAALDNLIAALGPSKTALVFTSGGPITAICQNLLSVPDSPAQRMNWTMANCGVTKIIYSERSRYLSPTLNEHAHFEGAHSKVDYIPLISSIRHPRVGGNDD